MREKILNSLQENPDLPPLPKILLELQKLADDPDCNVNDVCLLIKTELALSGKLLTLSNSAFYSGGREKASTIEEAIVRLGIDQALDICYCIEIPKCFEKRKSFDQTQFWRHSLATGSLSRKLTEKIFDDKNTINASFTSGLLHDIGILVFYCLIPEEFHEFLHAKDTSSSELPMEFLEKSVFGIDHQELGTLFLKKWWELPQMVVNGMIEHHKEFKNDGKNITLAQVVSAANKLANESGICHPVGTQHKEALNEEFLNRAGISEKVLASIIQDVKLGLFAFDFLFES